MDVMELKLSIIIPAYNVEKYIIRCLDSIYAQDLPIEEYEVIVVNDGSTDCTLEILRNYRKANLRIISQNNQKLGAARNNGTKTAIGNYIWFVDADDWIEPNVLKHLISLAYEYSLDLLSFDCVEKEIISDSILSGISYIQNSKLKQGACRILYRREFLLENSLFFKEGVVYEDNEFLPRVFYYAKRIKSIKSQIYNYYMNPYSITHNPIVGMNVLYSLLSNVIDMKSFSDKVYDENKRAGKVLYGRTAMTFNTFLLKMVQAEKDVSDKFITKYREAKSEIVYAMRKSNSKKYKIESIMLCIFPIKLICFLYQIQYIKK